MRALLLAHRYLGIIGGALMVLWCASGFVMLYVSYPRLSEARRLAGLEKIDWSQVRSAQTALPVEGASAFRIEMLAGRPVLSIRQSSASHLTDLTNGAAIPQISAEQATRVANGYLSSAPKVSATLLDRVAQDQWTVSGQFKLDRPLYHFALNDEEKTVLYVSSTSGRLVQATTAKQRFWNWLGPIPHWLYFLELRRHPQQWTQVVIATSLLGCFLTLTGLYLGFVRWSKRRQVAPAGRDAHSIHYLSGLFFGVFALTWVASGLLSVQPWGLLESSSVGAAELRGPLPSAEQVSAALRALSARLADSGFVSVEFAPFEGKPCFIARNADESSQRLDALGRPSALNEADFSRLAQRLASPAPVLRVTTEDRYLFSHHEERVTLPAYRVTLPGAKPTYLYLDATTGAVEALVDRNARTLRWIEGLHRLDLFALLRTRPIWDLVALFLLFGVSVVCVSGAWLGAKRLFVRKR